MNIFEDKLSNGVRVVSERLKDYRSVSISLWVKAGSVDEGEGEGGISHFIEHMIFKGTKNRTASEIASQMDALGGNLNAFTSKECTCFYAKVLDEHLPLAADMISDMALNSKLSDDDIEREKGVVVEKINMAADSPEDIAHESIVSLMFEDDPLQKPILGTTQSVMSMTRDDMINYMAKRYVAGNMVIACAGNFERESLIEVLEKSFKDVSIANAVQDRNYGNMRQNRAIRSIHKDIEQVHICLGLPGFPMDTKGQYPLVALSNILGGTMSSRLFQRIREEEGLAYSVYSFPTSYCTAGYFGLYAGTGDKQAEMVIDIMMEELYRLKKDGLTDAELRRSKEQLKGSYILGLESTSSHASAIGKSALLRGKVSSEHEVLERVQSITMDDINGIIPKVLDFSRLCTVFVGKDCERLVGKMDEYR